MHRQGALCPGGESVSVPVHEGRAVFLGEHAGFYQLTAGAAEPPVNARGEKAEASANPAVTTFAANLLDAAESAIAPGRDKLLVDGKGRGLREPRGVAGGVLDLPAARRGAAHGAGVGHLPPEVDGMSVGQVGHRRAS